MMQVLLEHLGKEGHNLIRKNPITTTSYIPMIMTQKQFDPDELDNEDELYPMIMTQKQFEPEELDNEDELCPMIMTQK